MGNNCILYAIYHQLKLKITSPSRPLRVFLRFSCWLAGNCVGVGRGRGVGVADIAGRLTGPKTAGRRGPLAHDLCCHPTSHRLRACWSLLLLYELEPLEQLAGLRGVARQSLASSFAARRRAGYSVRHIDVRPILRLQPAKEELLDLQTGIRRTRWLQAKRSR